MSEHKTADDDVSKQIVDLEQQQSNAAKGQSSRLHHGSTESLEACHDQSQAPQPTITLATSSLHTILLLADSALPLGSFAFSAGLESYLAHHCQPAARQLDLLHTFLPQSLLSLASTSLPYVLVAWHDPARLVELDDAFDASVLCTVARRASTSQGRALLGVWERSFRHTVTISDDSTGHVQSQALAQLNSFGRTLKLQPTNTKSLTASPFDVGYVLSAHLGPLWGVVCRVMSVDEKNTAYLYLFSHARTVVSAAVRAGVLGPYQAQAELASAPLQSTIERLITDWWHVPPEDAAQVVPILDLWVGRHEKLYSRIFNS